MKGISAVELLVPTNPIPDIDAAAERMEREAASASSTTANMASDKVILSSVPSGSTPINCYRKDFFRLSHPEAFFWDVGDIPEGCSLLKYARWLVRHPPNHLNPALLWDLYSVHMIQSVNAQVRLVIRDMPQLVETLATISDEELKQALAMVGKTGNQLHKAMQQASPRVRLLLQAMRITGARIPGTLGAKLSARCMLKALANYLGPMTAMLNICPVESLHQAVWEMGGKKYAFDVYGVPTTRPTDIEECQRFTAAHFFACNEFFHLYLAAFSKIILHWPMGAKHQEDPETCIAGEILALAWTKEQSGRIALHAHGTLLKRWMQVMNLIRIFEQERTDFAARILAVGEQLCAAYLPSVQPRR